MRASSLVPLHTHLTNNVLVCVVHLFGDTGHHYLGILWQIPLSLPQTLPARRHALPCTWCQCREFLALGFRHHASLLHCTLGFEPCTLFSYSFIHLFIPPPGFRFPLVVLGETSDLSGNTQQWALQLWPSWLDAIYSISISTSSSGNCYRSSYCFTSKANWDCLAVAGSLSFQVRMWGENLHLFTCGMWAVKSQRNMWCCYIHTADCTAETFAIEYVVYLGSVATRAVCDQVCDSLLEPGVADVEIIVYGEFPNSLTFRVMATKALSTMGIAQHTDRSANVTIPVTNWDKYLSGWDLCNRILQLVVEMFLFSFRSTHLRCAHREEGENCLAADQLEMKDPIRDALDFNNLVCPVPCQQCTGLCTEELEFAVLNLD